MDIYSIDWIRKGFDAVHLIILSLWCVCVLNKTLSAKETKGEKIKRGLFSIILVPMVIMISSVGMNILSNYTFQFQWEENSFANIIFSCLYIVYNTFYALAPTFLCYLYVHRFFQQDYSVKIFTAVFVGLIAIDINEFIYQCVIFPFGEKNEEMMLRIQPSRWFAEIVFIGVLIILYFIYKKFVCERLKAIIHTPDGRMGRFVKVPVASNIFFATLISILQTFGLAMNDLYWVNVMLYFMVTMVLSVVYFMMYWSIFTGISLSSERMKDQAELSIANKIQSSVLPNIFPPYPEHDEFQIFASMEAAKDVGGDFYDFFFIDNTHLAILIADVSGKGVPAALFMMRARTLIRSLASNKIKIEDVFFQANNALCENNDAEMFVTAWMGIVHIHTGVLEFVNAGHNPPLWIHNGEDSVYMSHKQYKRSLMLGAREHVIYHKNEVSLKEGDILYLYTDGASEANNRYGDFYGEQRLKECLDRVNDRNPEVILKTIQRDINEFAIQTEQFDDITMLGLYVDKLKNVLSISVDSMNMREVSQFVEKQLLAYGCEQKLLHQALLATDEIFSNIIKYSNATQATIRCHMEQDEIRISFVDNGQKYNPLEAKDPDINAPLIKREKGGLGIYVVKNIMDTTEYSYQNGCNTLTIQKNMQK